MSEIASISVSNARLPASYQNARSALADCARLDECMDWADKAAALASYAKQANDDEMMKMAVRIRDRAIRRAGELLKQIEPNPGKRTDLEPSAAADTRLTRSDAAEQAGMSKRQAVTAIRVANIPADEFERQIESRNPPTVTALAEQGKKAAPKPIIDLDGRDPDEFNRAMHYLSGWDYAAKDLAKLEHDRALPILIPSEVVRLREAIASIDAITDEYDRMAVGCRQHAAELREYVRCRRVAA